MSCKDTLFWQRWWWADIHLHLKRHAWNFTNTLWGHMLLILHLVQRGIIWDNRSPLKVMPYIMGPYIILNFSGPWTIFDHYDVIQIWREHAEVTYTSPIKKNGHTTWKVWAALVSASDVMKSSAYCLNYTGFLRDAHRAFSTWKQRWCYAKPPHEIIKP